MNNWKLELTPNGVSSGNVEIRRGISQGLSPLLFVLSMVPLLILRKVKFHYEFYDKKTMINHLLFLDDLKSQSQGIKSIHW